MTRRSKRPDPIITERSLTACANPDCRGALIPGDACGDLCGRCHRAEQRATTRSKGAA